MNMYSADVKDSDQITSLFYKDINSLLCCTKTGDIVDIDTRCKAAKVTKHKNHGSSASFWKLAIQMDQSDLFKLLQVSSDGEILVLDSRFTVDCVQRFQAALNTSKDYEYLTCQWCPRCDDSQKISVSDVKDSDQITSLFYKDINSLLCCTKTGDIVDIDTRCKAAKVTKHKNHGSSASFWKLAIQMDQSDLFKLLQVSSDGEILVLDSRFTVDCVQRFQAALNTSKDYEYLTCQWCPRCDDSQKISVSGFDGMVYIYNASSLQCQTDGLEPVFIHEGHVRNCDKQSDPPLVVKHLWHPWQRDLVLSVATDGSLHAWQYQEVTS